MKTCANICKTNNDKRQCQAKRLKQTIQTQILVRISRLSTAIDGVKLCRQRLRAVSYVLFVLWL